MLFTFHIKVVNRTLSEKKEIRQDGDISEAATESVPCF